MFPAPAHSGPFHFNPDVIVDAEAEGAGEMGIAEPGREVLALPFLRRGPLTIDPRLQ